MYQKPNILSTPFATAYNMNMLAKNAAKFLVANSKNADLTEYGYANLLQNTNTMTFSHMTTMFRNIVEAGKLSSLYLYSFSRGQVGDIPEMLTIDDVSVDAKFIDATIPPELRKVWVNLTPMVASNKKDRNGPISVSDVPRTVSTIVRAFLCTSYNDSVDEWLSPKISTFVIEFYTMAMSSVLVRTFNLDWEESHLINLLFTWYYASLLGPKTDNDAEPMLLHKNARLFKGISNSDQLATLMADINAVRGTRAMSIEVIIEVIHAMGPARMRSLKSGDMYRMISLASADTTSMMIAIDYPPYFVHQILRTVSGAKHPILSNVVNNRMNKADVLKTLDLLVRDKAIISGVNR